MTAWADKTERTVCVTFGWEGSRITTTTILSSAQALAEHHAAAHNSVPDVMWCRFCNKSYENSPDASAMQRVAQHCLQEHADEFAEAYS